MPCCFKFKEQKALLIFIFLNKLFNFLHLQLEDCALQIYRYHSGAQADFGTYLDLEATLDEQADDLEGFTDQ